LGALSYKEYVYKGFRIDLPSYLTHAQALIIAKLREGTFPGIIASSIGVIFLGTPHRGSRSFLPQSALLTAIAEHSDLYGGIEPEVLDTMRSDDGALLEVAEDFTDLCRDKGLEVACFFEQRKSNLGKIIGKDNIQARAKFRLLIREAIECSQAD
jgi:hypothetical protein